MCDPVMVPGFVYILSNPGFPGFKVGQTTRTAENRAAELRREYGAVFPFEVVCRFAVANPAAVEALAHRILRRYRVPRSELFVCDLKTCRRAIEAAAVLALERPWWLRLWHWIILPHPTPTPRRRSYRRGGGGSVVFLLAVAAAAMALVQLKPELPSWMPAQVLRAAYLIERLHR